MKILMAYIHYPVSIAKYWKLGLQSLGHEVDSIGYCTADTQAWYVKGKPIILPGMADVPTYPLGNQDIRYIIGDLIFRLTEKYDLFINVDAACWFIGKTACPKVIIGTDPHCVGYDRQRDDCNLFVCMQKCYSKDNDAWIPYAYEPSFHFHADVPEDHDVTFLGVLYEDRIQDLKKLAAAGIKVVSDTGIVFDQGSPIYSAAPIAYCRPSQLDLPARFFEAMAYGCIPLTTEVPDLKEFDFEPGWHYELYEGDIVAAANRILSDAKLNERRAACLEAIKPHTWEARASKLIELCTERGLVK